jgi:hypothetical protein
MSGRIVTVAFAIFALIAAPGALTPTAHLRQRRSQPQRPPQPPGDVISSGAPGQEEFNFDCVGRDRSDDPRILEANLQRARNYYEQELERAEDPNTLVVFGRRGVERLRLCARYEYRCSTAFVQKCKAGYLQMPISECDCPYENTSDGSGAGSGGGAEDDPVRTRPGNNERRGGVPKGRTAGRDESRGDASMIPPARTPLTEQVIREVLEEGRNWLQRTTVDTLRRGSLTWLGGQVALNQLRAQAATITAASTTAITADQLRQRLNDWLKEQMSNQIHQEVERHGQTAARNVPRQHRGQGRYSPVIPGGGLIHHEGVGFGHAIREHVGLNWTDLAERLHAEPNIPSASSFYGRTVAEAAITSALNANEAAIRDWLATGGNQYVIPAHPFPNRSVFGPVSFDLGTGISLERGSPFPVIATRVLLVLRRYPASPTGYRIHTSYPVR